MKPYRPLDAPSTPTSNSPLSPLSRQASQDPPDLAKPPSSRGASPDVTSSPSELSRRIGGSSSNTFTRSPSPVPVVRRSPISQSELVDSEPRPGPEDAEGSTRRWSFRSRKANQLQPYRFDLLQYKRQLRGNPDAVVAALNPHRRRSSPGSSLDQDFIVDEENTQETGELSGLTITGEEESQSQSRASYDPRRGVPSRRANPPAQPPPQWYLDGVKEISDTGSGDDEVVGYLADRSRKQQAAAEANNNDGAPVVSREWSLGILEPDPPTRIQTNQMASLGGGGNGVLNPHHGFATSKNRHPDHPTLQHPIIATRVARVQRACKHHPLILSPYPLVLRLIHLVVVRHQFTLSRLPADDHGCLRQLSPQTILRQIRKRGSARSSFEHSVVCCLQE